MKRLLLIMLMMCFGMPGITQAQTSKKVSISGTITEFATKQPIIQAIVSIPELNVWAVADEKGNFKLPAVTPGAYVIDVNCLGYEKKTLNVTVDKEITNLAIQLKEDNLTLDNVTVTAKRVGGINSSSRVDKRAMDYIQATSLSDVMQLMPGNLTQNPKLTSEQRLSVRDLGGTGVNNYNAYGTGLVVDGAQYLNDANLSGKDGTAANNGIDARVLSTDNIESVDVVMGVASAVYGDMTSGAVIVKTKAGKSPYEVRAKLDPDAKTFSVSKGFGLPNNSGFLNIDADYTRAYADTRSPSTSFDRGTVNLGYSNTFNKNRTPITFNVKFNTSLTKNSSKPDPDKTALDKIISDDNKFGLNINGNWALNKSWITNLEYSTSVRYEKQDYQELSWTQGLSIPTSYSIEEGEHLAEFTKAQYIADERTNSEPLYITGKLVAELSGRYGKIYNKGLLGVEYNGSGNNGKGKYFIGERPHEFRPNPYSDIPYINKLAAFAEDKITFPLGTTSLELQAGVRYTKTFTSVMKNTDSFDPRINIRYAIIRDNNEGVVRNLSVRGGWGITSKAYSLNMMYPYASYKDYYSFKWNGSGDTEGERLALVNTFKTTQEEARNRDLKLAKSTKYEAGVDFDILGVRGSLVYYNELLKNGFGTDKTMKLINYTTYNQAPDPKDTQRPVYTADGLMFKDINTGALTTPGSASKPVFQDTLFRGINRAANRVRESKWGIEYTLDFGMIKSLRTSLIVDGAYRYQKGSQVGGTWDYVNNSIQMVDPVSGKTVIRSYPTVAYFNDETGIQVSGSEQSRLSTSFRFITHIPKLRLVTSIEIQAVWIDKSQRLQSDDVYCIVDGKRVYGDFTYGTPNGSSMFRDPSKIMDLQGNIIPWTESMNSNPYYNYNLQTSASQTPFRTSSYNPYFLANFRLTKEIGNHASVSFYANNFTNSQPRRKPYKGGTYARMNNGVPVYFGGEIKLNF